jgi:hypothetical protein
MPVNQIYVGTSGPKGIYVGTSRVKQVYVGTTLVYADPRTITISLGTGVASVEYAVIEANGVSGPSGTLTSSGSVTVGYGAQIAFLATASTGYNLGSYTTSYSSVTADFTASFTATRKTYTVTISKGTGISGATYTIYNAAGTATATGQTATTATVEHGGKIKFTSVTASTGYQVNSYTATHTITAAKTISLTASWKTYTVTISKGTGVSTVTYTIYNESGTATATGQTATTATVRHNGKIKITGVTVATGYNTATYTAEHTITAAKTISVATTRKTFTVTITKGTGISSFSWTRTKWSGGTTTGTTSPVTVEYGDSISVTGTASTGYQNPTTLSYSSITANKSGTLTATPIPYTVTIRIMYNSTKYTSKVGTVTGTYSNTSGGTSNISASHGCTITVPYNGQVKLTSTTPVTGFAYSSGATTYTITGNKTIDVVFTAKTATSSFSLVQNSGSADLNRMSKSGFTVTAQLIFNVNEVAAGTTLATIPASYRPTSNKTYTNSSAWHTAKTFTNTTPTTSTPTITFGSNGNVTSNLKSYGVVTYTVAGGGKWGGGSNSTTYNTLLNVDPAVTWSTAP